jgi:hypothetical protein
MFCDACGTKLEAGQQFCSRCGKPITGAPVAGYPRVNRVQQHIHLLGILWLAASALNAVGGAILIILANTLFLHISEMGVPQSQAVWLHPFLGYLGILILVKAAFGFIAGWGLLQREPWGRMLTLILSFLALFNVPFGTALGIYSLWVLLPDDAEQEYEEQVRRIPAA